MSLVPTRHLLIIGSGITGLSTAHHLVHYYQLYRKNGIQSKYRLKIDVVEKQSRYGGWIHSHDLSGTLFELGPRSLQARNNPSALLTSSLISQLQLQSQLIPASYHAKKRFIVHNGIPMPLPAKPLQMIFSKAMLTSQPPLRGILSGALHDLFISTHFSPYTSTTSIHTDQSIADYFTTRFNKDVVDGLIDPMTGGIYAGNPHQLSVKSCFPTFFTSTTPTSHPSLIRSMFRKRTMPTPTSDIIQRFPHLPIAPGGLVGVDVDVDWIKQVRKSGIYSFKDGLSTLPNAIVSRLSHVEQETDGYVSVKMRLGTGVDRLHITSHDDPVQATIGNDVIPYDHVFSTITTRALARILTDTSSQSSHLISLLNSITYATVWTVNVAYTHDVLPKHLIGFGLLVPSCEGGDVLGIVFDSCTFPNQSTSTSTSTSTPTPTRLTVMMGGDRHHHVLNLSPEEIQSRALAAIQRLCHITSTPSSILVSRHVDCIPQMYVGHSQRIADIQKAVTSLSSHLSVYGTIHGVSVGDCIFHGHQHAQKYIEKIMS